MANACFLVNRDGDVAEPTHILARLPSTSSDRSSICVGNCLPLRTTRAVYSPVFLDYSWTTPRDTISLGTPSSLWCKSDLYQGMPSGIL